MEYFDNILHKYACQHGQTTGMCDSPFLINAALPSIILAGRGQLEKMLITLEPHGLLASKFCMFINYSNIFQPLVCKTVIGFAEHHFRKLRSLSESAHNSWAPWSNSIKNCILIIFYIV